MSTEKLAKVDDVIEHGQDIPGNVVRMVDDDGEYWARQTREPLSFEHDAAVADSGVVANTVPLLQHIWFPMTVVEVDPEPQPAAPSAPQVFEVPQPDGPLLGLATTRQLLEELKARRVTAPSRGEAYQLEDTAVALLRALTPAALDYRTAEPRQPAAPQPVVLRLPKVPAGAVALVGGATGWRWTLDFDRGWSNGKPGVSSVSATFHEVLLREHPDGVTVEFAPPREPRTWPKLDPAPNDLRAVEVVGHGVFRRHPNTDGWSREGDSGLWFWRELLELGEVREVLDGGAS